MGICTQMFDLTWNGSKNTSYIHSHLDYIKDLLTEREVCTGKYCLRFSYRPSDEGARSVR